MDEQLLNEILEDECGMATTMMEHHLNDEDLSLWGAYAELSYLLSTKKLEQVDWTKAAQELGTQDDEPN